MHAGTACSCLRAGLDISADAVTVLFYFLDCLSSCHIYTLKTKPKPTKDMREQSVFLPTPAIPIPRHSRIYVGRMGA